MPSPPADALLLIPVDALPGPPERLLYRGEPSRSSTLAGVDGRVMLVEVRVGGLSFGHL